MFGGMRTPPETTSTLRACLDAAIGSGRPVELSGGYVVDGAITSNTSYPRASLDLRLDGDVSIEVVADAEPIEYFLVAVSDTSSSHRISGGSLTLLCNDRVQRALAIASNSGGTTAGGRVEILAPVRIRNVHAPLGSNGIAYAANVSGPFEEVTINGLDIEGVSRHPLLSLQGDCKGLRVDRALGPVTIIDTRIRDVRNAIQDADGVFVMSQLIDGSPAGPLVRIVGGHFEDCQGRSIKTQVAHTEVRAAVFRRAGVTSIRESCEIDAQYGSLDVNGWRAEYARRNGGSPLGRNHCPIVVQALHGPTRRRSRITAGELVSAVDMICLVFLNVGPDSPDHDVLIQNIQIEPSDRLGAKVFKDALIAYRPEGVAAAGSTLSIAVRDVQGPEGLRLCDTRPPPGAAASRVRLSLAPASNALG